MERDAEIAQINRELEVLRGRYAIYQRIAFMTRGVFMVLMPALAIGVIGVAIMLRQFDAFPGILLVAAALVLPLAIRWLVVSSGLRWIDLVSSQARGIYDPYFFYPDAKPPGRTPSDAELLERQIADRERRLAESGENVPRTNR